MTQTTAFTVSVIMPALNEERTIRSVIDETTRAFEACAIEGQVIVVNDGSSDKTASIVEECIRNDSRIKLLTHRQCQGIGASFWDGVTKAEGDVVLLIPADGENDPFESLRYVSLLEHVDIVIPFAYEKSARSFFRTAVSQLFRQIINTTFRTAFHYTNGTVLYRRSILGGCRLTSHGFFFQTELLIKLVNQGYLFAEVPYRLRRRSDGRSKAISLLSLSKVVVGYLQLVRDVYFRKDSGSGQLQSAENSVTLKRRQATSNTLNT